MSKPITRIISYTSREADKLLAMEEHLMEKFGYNRSQLHKQLVREAYNRATTTL
tara:strand:- start:801 stop:962 length:162 start_codon:yes stop_codon:yes gene_type:complete